MQTFRAIIALGLALTTSACLSTETAAVRDAPTRVAVTHADVIVAGPPGFCVDLDASRNQERRAFILLASCAAVSNHPLMPQPDLPVVLTASVAEGSAANPRVIEAYLQSPAGIENLANKGAVDRMRIQSDSEAVFVFTSGPGGDQWRGIIPLRQGFIVTVSIEPTGKLIIPEKAQLAALDQFADQILAANPTMVLTTSGL